jgi:recombinational DNA repair ATPase RecF
MEITKVKIKNYRSIASAEIDFSENCKFLIGINESGKSNFLKALSLLGDSEIDKNGGDLRVVSKDEEDPKESYVKFYLSLTKDNLEDIIEDSSYNFLGSPKSLDNIFLKSGKPIL